jgi:thymidylate synthase (FAD)
MEVKLISLTKGIEEMYSKQDASLPAMTPEQLIVYIARVSNPANQMNTETSDKLIAYLIKNKHWSPLEMCDMTISIVTSRAIAQQILRHRSFSFQEFSQRYAVATDFEPVQLRKQADKNRQSSTDKFDTHTENLMLINIQNHIDRGEELYKILLNKGVAKECARMVLPLTTQTKIYMKGSVRSWIHYLQIRCDSHAQLEHRQVAEEIKSIFKTEFPNISKAIF